jgi:hypothetical protein
VAGYESKESLMKQLRIKTLEEHGQSMVELALSITILLALLAGTIDLGRGLFTWMAMRDGAQEGATYGAINPPDADFVCTPLSPHPELCRRVYDNFRHVIKDPESQMIIYVSFPDGKSCLGQTIQVDVDYPAFPLGMPFFGVITGKNSIPIHATIKDSILVKPCN